MAASADTARPTRWQMLRFLVHLPRLLRLYWRLLCDPRVSIWPKAMLVAAAAYVVFPFDLIPDVIPVLGEVDDAVILLAAAHWFIQWCPAEVVAEHSGALAAG